MDFYGDINLLNNEMQKMVLQSETQFPDTAVVGRIVFKEGRVFICAALNGSLPVWVPLTNKIDTYIHNQVAGSTTWTITHNLNNVNPLIQIYDDNLFLQIPQTVKPLSNNQIQVTFGTAVSGRAVLMLGQLDFGGGVIQPESIAYVHTQSSAAGTWVVRHKLGYYPIVRVFDSNSEEIQPQSIIQDDVFQTTITFSSARTGTARFV